MSDDEHRCDVKSSKLSNLENLIVTSSDIKRAASLLRPEFLPSPFHWKAICIYFTCWLNFLSVAVTLVAAVSIVNQVVNNDPNINSSTSAFVNSTVYFLANVTDLLFEKYNASLSDYVGRKPMLVISQLSSFVSRLLLLVSRNVPTFYIAGIFYGFGNFFYNVCIAWLCDVLKKEDRGRAFGLLLGISIGLGFTVGLPVGAVLTIPDPYLPVQISLIVSAVNMLFLLLVPVDDTVCTQLREIEHQLDSGSNTSTNKSKTKYVTNPVVAHTSSTSDSSQNKTQLTSSQWKMWPSGLLSHRELPVDINHYLIHNSLYGVLKVLQLSFITFGIQVFGWSTAVAGIALAFVGITVAIVSPLFLTRYDEMSMVTLGASVQSIGYLFLAIVGSNISAMGVVYALGYLAVALLAFGGLWISSLQALILRQYPENIQGEVAGALAQVNLLAVIPAYPISLLFSYMLSSAATIYWPGVIFALTTFSMIIGLSIHCYAHSRERLWLNRRPPKVQLTREIASLDGSGDI